MLSAGGYGHVPIPLFKQPEESLAKSLAKGMVVLAVSGTA